MKWTETTIHPSMTFNETFYESKRLLVWVADGYREGGIVAFGYCSRGSRTGNFTWHAEGFSRGFNITHWMELPEGPDGTKI